MALFEHLDGGLEENNVAVKSAINTLFSKFQGQKSKQLTWFQVLKSNSG